jgi:glycosyltransferase involved in cell wall biosynthesis
MPPTAPWHIVSGEYPPAHGGVADYTRSLARGLALAGEEVHVWAPLAGDGLATDPGVTLHPLPRGFGPLGLPGFVRDFRRQPAPLRVLVQYVPQAFGMRGMNLPFCLWLAALRDAQVWVMFHEVVVPWHPWVRPHLFALSVATRAMATLLLARADRIFLSIPGWEPMLRPLAPRWPEAAWLPIPSNLPTDVPAGAAAAVRTRLPLREGATLIGHFSTYGRLVAPPLKQEIVPVLRTDPRRFLLLMGRGGPEFARELRAERAIAGQVLATGDLAAPDVAAHLAACDVLVQPYVDGVSTRRTSVMAGLALGVPIATNDGWLTEPVWRESGAVALADSTASLAAAVEGLLADPGGTTTLGARGRNLYRDRFALDRTLHTLRAFAAEEHEPPAPA